MNALEPPFPHFDTHQSNLYDQAVTANTNSYLIRMDALTSSKIEPDLAQSWEIAPDGRKITFRLRVGPKFHDGTAVVCEDVVYSFQRVLNPPSGMASPRKGQYGPISAVRCQDPATAVFELSKPWADALFNIADPFMIIYPKHVAEPLDAKGQGMRTTVMGSGAFKLKRFVTQEVVELERNTDYWKPGLPYLDGMKYFILEQEARIWATALQSGRADYMFGGSLRSKAVLDEVEANSKGRWSVRSYPLISMEQFIPRGDAPPWNDVDVRKAVALAVCHKTLRETLMPINFAGFPGGMLPEGSYFALPASEREKIAGYGTDCAAKQAEAKRILESKGLTKYSFTIHTLVFPQARDTSIALCGQLADVGLKCTTDAMETGPFYDLANLRRIPRGDAIVLPTSIANRTVDAILGQAFHPDGVRNYGNYQDDELKALFDKQSQELDQAKRRDLILEYQRKFLSSYHHVILSWLGAGQATWNYVRGPVLDTQQPDQWWPQSWEEMWLAK